MNYLNGGYVMIKHNATQTELKTAYESKKPVLYYDATGIGTYGNVKKTDNTYEFVPSVLYHRNFDVENKTDGILIRFDIHTSYSGEITADNLAEIVYNSICNLKPGYATINSNEYYSIATYSDEDSIYVLYDDSGTIKQTKVDYGDLLSHDITITEY